MIEIAICDDEPVINSALETMLNRFAPLLPEPIRIHQFCQGSALLDTLVKQPLFDIIFLDIELGDTTGIAVAEQIRKHFEEIALIFVSAYESYCKELFQFDTTGFLGKPIDENEVKALLVRVYKGLRNSKRVFVYRVKDAIYRVRLADILFFESKARKIQIVTRQENTGTPAYYPAFYGKLDDVEAQLKHPGFVRIHHSFLVNLDNVERFEKSVLVLPGAYRLALARSTQKEVRGRIMDYYSSTNGAEKMSIPSDLVTTQHPL
ncbi:MAG: LytTR family DNA-binding domain-containing protein [Treponema sp.]|jgi:DNA-binding LytR/AlgR family response regulator|nr:LytTR family DNA-binding domain-containing protein [Treponema sp.]